jgi:hypothetical protein
MGVFEDVEAREVLRQMGEIYVSYLDTNIIGLGDNGRGWHQFIAIGAIAKQVLWREHLV